MVKKEHSKQDESATYNLMLNKALVGIVRRLGSLSISKIIEINGYNLLCGNNEEYERLIKKIDNSLFTQTQKISVKIDKELHKDIKMHCKKNHFFISSLANAFLFSDIVEHARPFTDRNLNSIEDLLSYIEVEYTGGVEEMQKDFQRMPFSEWVKKHSLSKHLLNKAKEILKQE